MAHFRKIYMPLYLGLLRYLIVASMNQSSGWQLSLHFVKTEMVWKGGIYFNTTTTELFFICQKHIYCFYNFYFTAIFYNWHTEM